MAVAGRNHGQDQGDMGRGERPGDDADRFGLQLALRMESAERAMARIVGRGSRDFDRMTIDSGRAGGRRGGNRRSSVRACKPTAAQRYRSVKDQHQCDQGLTQSPRHRQVPPCKRGGCAALKDRSRGAEGRQSGHILESTHPLCQQRIEPEFSDPKGTSRTGNFPASSGTLNHLARFREGEAPAEPIVVQARPEPRPGLAKGWV